MPRLNQKVRTDGGVQAVALAMQLIEAMASADEPCRLTDLATSIGTSKARVFRHLRTLAKLGYVAHDGDSGRYRIGSRLAELGATVAGQFDLARIGRPIMRQIARDTGFTVVLSKVENNSVYRVEQMPGSSPIALRLKAGGELGIYGAQGKIVLAFGHPDLLESVIDQGRIVAHTPDSIVNPQTLRREIDLVRERGWANARGERRSGLDALAVPVFTRDGELTATLACLGPIDAIPTPPMPRHLAALTNGAEKITNILPRQKALAV
jgi:DNA-binding IclR family transcriptional regulator